MPFASRFPLPPIHPCRFIRLLSLYPPSLFASLFARVLVCLIVVMSEIGEVIANMGDNNIMENSDAPAKEPTIFHTNKFRVGSGNIIGKGVI